MDCLHYINGQYVPSVDGKTFDNLNPATGEKIGFVAEGGCAEIDMAVQAARRAFDHSPWRTMPMAERMKIIRRIADLIEENQEEFTRLEVMDTGKPWSLASHLDIPRGSNNFRVFADFATSMSTECYVMDDVAVNYAVRKPVGVVGVISPWNLPLLLMTWKVAPALAAGNCVVVKPAELTPLTATRLGAITKEAGLPDGVFNVVHGFGPHGAGQALTEHPGVNAITFTGETTTGQAIMAASAKTLKKLSFELGGKNPNIIFADADLEDCLETTVRSSFANQGQVCLAGSRIYVQRPLYDIFVERLAERARKIKAGDPMDPDTALGSLISKEHLDRVMSYVELAQAEGGRILTGGQPVTVPGCEGGSFLEPTVIVDLEQNCRSCREEIFGPVVAVLPFDDEDEVVAKANDTDYGLSATIWTQDVKRAHRVAARVEAGIVWVNTWFLRDLRTPFGGTKRSGIGREGGVHSFEFYSELTNICIKL